MKLRAVFLALLMALLVLCPSRKAEAGPRIDVVIRFDDYASGMDTDSVLRFFLLFEKRSIPVTFAVIPFGGAFPKAPAQPEPQPLTEEKAWILKRMLSTGGFEVAQHGFSHEENAKDSPQGSSEFRGLPLREQMARITRGKELLENRLGIRVKSFVPPWNTYDENTVFALKQCGFLAFSPGGPDSALQSAYNMPVIGCCAGVATLKARVEEARKGKDPHPIITALFHIYEIRDFEPKGTFTLAELAETLDWLKAQPDVHFVTLLGAAKKLRPKNPCRTPSDALRR